MKLSLLLLSLCVLFVAFEITPATSNYLRLRGESGASGPAVGGSGASGPEGNSTNGTDEAEKEEDVTGNSEVNYNQPDVRFQNSVMSAQPMVKANRGFNLFLAK